MSSRLALPQPMLWRPGSAADARRVTWIELFFDLVFVAVVAQVGAPLAHDYSFGAIARYAFLLVVTWWAWHGYAVYATRFDAGDRIQRATTLLQMVAVIFMAANAEGDLASESSAGFAAAYALMRLILVGEYVRAAAVPAARRLARDYALGYGAAATLWLASALLPLPARFALWTLAFAIDMATAVVTARHSTVLPPHAAHLPERFGLFTLILLGESIVAIVKGIQAQADWTLAAATPAFFGIGLIFAMWWGYFEAASGAADRHVRTPRDARWLDLWSYAHVPLYLGVAIAAIGIEHVVASGGGSPLPLGESVLLTGAVSTFMLALTFIAVASDRVAADVRGRLVAAGTVLAAAALTLAWLGQAMPPGIAVIGLVVLTTSHAVLLARARSMPHA